MKKHKLNIINILLLSISIIFIFSSCGKDEKTVTDLNKGDNTVAPWDTAGAITGDWVIMREMADAEKLNPVVTNDASADQVDVLIFENLNNVDNETFELMPWIASLPEISDDHLSYTYHLSKDVKFSDGSHLTGVDVIFSMKAIKNPFADDAALRNYYESLKKIELVNGDPYTIKVTMSKPYWRAIYSNGTFPILPKSILDPEGLTDKYDWSELTDYKIAEKNPVIRKFGDFLNTQEVSREPKYVVGSGPYMLEKWETGQALNLKKNPNYWGKKLSPAYPEKIIFKIIQDKSGAIVSAKNNDVDVMYVEDPTDFYKNMQDPGKFHLQKATPLEPVFSYIGWNQKNPLFADKRVRMALAYLIDRKTIIDKINFGMSVPIQSPVFYKDKKYLNTDLPEIPYDPEKAKQLLAEAGWKDSDGDGVLDKIVDGKKMNFKFTFLNNNNPVRKQTLLIIIDAMKKIGIQADLQDLEWSVYLDKTKKHEFDATLAAWQLGVLPPDEYQIWHSSQAQGEGSNYISFINAESDKILEDFRTEFDEAKRIEMLKKWQKLIYDEQPYTFLWSPKARYIYNDRFKNTRWYNRGNSPALNEWWVPKSLQKYTQSMN